MKKILFILTGIIFSLSCISCNTDKSEKNEPDNILHVHKPTFKKFVISTVDNVKVYKEAKTESPTCVIWSEDIESDMAELKYEWSDMEVPDKYVMENFTESAGTIFAVLDEEGDFYKVSIYNEYCKQVAGYILKSATEDIEPQALSIDSIKNNDWERTTVVTDGKYKDLVIRSISDELNGEKIQLGLFIDGVIAFPANYEISTWMDESSKELKYELNETEYSVTYPSDMVYENKETAMPMLDTHKLTEQQIDMIFDNVVKGKPTVVRYEYNFPNIGNTQLSFFIVDKSIENNLDFIYHDKYLNKQNAEGSYNDLVILIPEAVGKGERQDKMNKAIHTICDGSQVAGELGKAPAGASIKEIADFYENAFNDAASKGTLAPMCVYSLSISIDYQNEAGAVVLIQEGIYGNGGPGERYVFVNLNDNKILQSKDLVSIPKDKAIELMKKYAPEGMDEAIEGGAVVLDEGLYHIMPADYGMAKMQVALSSHHFESFTMPVDSVKEYLTEEGKKAFALK